MFLLSLVVELSTGVNVLFLNMHVQWIFQLASMLKVNLQNVDIHTILIKCGLYDNSSQLYSQNAKSVVRQRL